jgi:hypothetical protein
MSERMLAKRSGARRVFLWTGAGFVVVALVNVVSLVAGSGEWWSLISPVVGLAAVFLAIGPWQARPARLIRRSVELNRQQLDERR